MKSIDQTGFEIELDSKPKRIISLVPSQTELLHYLGLEDEVVGITKFCIHPNAWFQGKERVGGTKKLDLDKIKSLQPDLIIGNKEENTKEDIEWLRKEYPVWLSDIDTMEEAIDMIDQVGIMTGVIPKAQTLIHKIFEAQADLPVSDKKVLYFIWDDPKMVVGKKTFIDAMLSEAGFVNCVSQERYPSLNPEDIKAFNPDFIFLSSEPFPFKEKHQQEFQKSFPNAKVELVDGELFSWYGSRLLKSFDYFRVLHERLVSK
jgi:ABC-type Fe3+-hydroxamate transport system substrate-binding protein